MHYMYEIEAFLAKAKNPVQLVKNHHELTKKAKEKDLTWPAVVQIKYDGVYCMAIRDVDGVVGFFSRTGNKFFIGAALLCKLGEIVPQEPGVYIGELVNDYISLERLSGYVNTNRKTPWTPEDTEAMLRSYIMFHDHLTLDELKAGKSKVGYAMRHDQLRCLVPYTRYVVQSYFCYTTYEFEQFAEGAIADGYEGAVRKEINADWVAGHKGYRTTKIVRGISTDLECVGVVIGEGKFDGLIAGLDFMWKGKRFTAGLGKGWDVDTMKVHTAAWQEDESNVVGQIWKVTALQESSRGVLRLPKVGEMRIDKEQADG